MMMQSTVETTVTQETQPQSLVNRFFSEAIENHTLSHAYILKGRQYAAMYQTALHVAQVLNCKEAQGGKACGQCQNCRWIQENSHPAVMTISRLTYQVGDKGEDLTPEEVTKLAKKSTPTQIKTEQISRLQAQLGLSSEYTRVVIFTDAEELPAEMASGAVPPFEWRNLEIHEDKSFHIRPLERRLFNAASANRFLKTLEEPPPRTLFFFIAETEEQLLETIVSRSQVIPYGIDPDQTQPQQGLPDKYRDFLARFSGSFSATRDTYVLIGEFASFFIEEEGLSAAQALEFFQRYLRERFLSQPIDAQRFGIYHTLQKAIEQAVHQINAKAHQEQTLTQLFFAIHGPIRQML